MGGTVVGEVLGFRRSGGHYWSGTNARSRRLVEAWYGEFGLTVDGGRFPGDGVAYMVGRAVGEGHTVVFTGDEPALMPEPTPPQGGPESDSDWELRAAEAIARLLELSEEIADISRQLALYQARDGGGA